MFKHSLDVLKRVNTSSNLNTVSKPLFNTTSSSLNAHNSSSHISHSSFYTMPPQQGSASPIPTWAPIARPEWHATTILAVRKGKKVVMIGDGQVSMGPTIVKPNARKVRRIGNGTVITGFAGATADAFTLVERLEAKLEEYPGQLLRAAVETAKCWRTDKYTRHLEALLIACDENISLCLSGNGDVIESHDGLIGIGSGGTYALAAARALIDIPEMDALTIAKKSMTIASDICVYTNSNFVIDSIDLKEDAPVVPSRI